MIMTEVVVVVVVVVKVNHVCVYKGVQLKFRLQHPGT
jgi:hypothetical protein